MKRLIILLFIFTLASCSHDSSQSSSNVSKSKKNKKEKAKKHRKGKKGKDDKEEDIIINVESIRVTRGDALSVFKTTTILEADLESAVTSKASGIVLKINVEVGDHVKEGDVLAVLESDVQQLRLQSAEANYQKSYHNYERAKSLLKKGLANQESVDNLKFETRSLKTNLEQAKLDVEFTKITAPISGVITQRNIKKGNLIQQNTKVYSIVNFDSLQAIINVPENKLSLFSNNLEVLFEFSSSEEIINGHIIRIDPVIDSATGTFKVVIAIDTDEETKHLLRPGLFGKTKIIVDRHKNTLLLSKNAVIREDNKAYVYAIKEDSTVTKQLIKIAYEMDDTLEVLEGLTEDQEVVTTGKNNVTEGTTVEVIQYHD